jgi:hypothetical protein
MEKPLLAFGHNECIFRKFIFTGKAWKGAKGELAIIPKDEGHGIMVSAVQSREFGFGLELTSSDQEIVNNFQRRQRPHYTETDAAMKLNGKTEKEIISKNPFFIYFEFGYGAGKDGCWTYNHMVLQFEDCIDVIQALYPQFGSLWIFDHSCSHDRG